MIKIIWAHPCIGKTTCAKKYPELFLDFDEEFKEIHKRSTAIFMNEGFSKNYIKIQETTWLNAKKIATETNRILLTSLRTHLRYHNKNFDLILNIPYENFLERVTKRQIISIETAINWKNQIEAIFKSNGISTLSTTSFFEDIQTIKNIIENPTIRY